MTTAWEAPARVRSQDRTRSLPILALTGISDIHAEQVLALGASEFLTKPVSPNVLTSLVGDLLAGRGRPPAPQQLDLSV